MDTDVHTIYNKDEEIINSSKNVIVGNNVWIGSRSIILKGSIIPNNSVVGAGTIYNKNIVKENCILAGNPCRIVKENVHWKK